MNTIHQFYIVNVWITGSTFLQHQEGVQEIKVTQDQVEDRESMENEASLENRELLVDQVIAS